MERRKTSKIDRPNETADLVQVDQVGGAAMCPWNFLKTVMAYIFLMAY